MSEQQHGVWEATQASSKFQKLKKSYRGFAFPLTIAFLVWYFLYVILTAFAREWVSTPVFGNVNIALILGVLQFISTFLIAWLYERHSSHKLDAPSEEIKHAVEKELAK